MKKQIAIPLLCLCAVLLLAGGFALILGSGLSPADAMNLLLEEPFWAASEELSKELPDGTRLPSDNTEPYRHAHAFNEEGVCVYDGALRTEQENGGYSIREYDPNHRWNPILETEYDAEGTVVKVTRYEYEYENVEDMEYKHRRIFENDVLVHETNCGVYPDVDPDHAYRENIDYLEDGGRTVSLYRYEYEDYVLRYDAEGSLIETERIENTYDAMGRLLGRVYYVNDVRTYEYLYFRSPCGVWLMDYEIYYDENGDPEQSYDWVYTNDDWGEPIYEVKTLNGAVIRETYYKDEYGIPRYIYREVIYDENGKVLTDTYYDPEGNEVYP